MRPAKTLEHKRTGRELANYHQHFHQQLCYFTWLSVLRFKHTEQRPINAVSREQRSAPQAVCQPHAEADGPPKPTPQSSLGAYRDKTAVPMRKGRDEDTGLPLPGHRDASTHLVTTPPGHEAAPFLTPAGLAPSNRPLRLTRPTKAPTETRSPARLGAIPERSRCHPTAARPRAAAL